MPPLQPELFDADGLEERLRALGLRGVNGVAVHENRRVLVSVTRGGVLRLHRGYAYAPDAVLRAVVGFVAPGTRRTRRAEFERGILQFPVHHYVSSRSARRSRPGRVEPEDRPAIRELVRLHSLLNTAHFEGKLSAIPIRVSRRMRRRLGELTLDPQTNQPVVVTISRVHLDRDDAKEVEHTLLHEMIHQWQAETGQPVDHGSRFRQKARAVGVAPRASRHVPRTTQNRNQ